MKRLVTTLAVTATLAASVFAFAGSNNTFAKEGELRNGKDDLPQVELIGRGGDDTHLEPVGRGGDDTHFEPVARGGDDAQPIQVQPEPETQG